MLDTPSDTPPETGAAAKPNRRSNTLVGDLAHTPESIISPRALLGVVRRYKGRLIASVLLIPLAAGMALHATTPRYTAIGTLLYDPPTFRMTELQSILRPAPVTDDVMASQADVMRGMWIAQRVATRMNLFDNSEFNRALNPASLPARVVRRITAWLSPAPAPVAGPAGANRVASADPGAAANPAANANARADANSDAPGDTSGGGNAGVNGHANGGTTARGGTARRGTARESTGRESTRRDQTAGPELDDVRNSVLLATQQAIGVTTIHDSHVATITFISRDRVLAAAAVNMVMDIYIKDQLAAKYRAVRKANEWLDARVAELRGQMRGDEDRIAAYRASHGIVQGMHAGLDAEQVSHLTEGLVQARGDLAAAESRLDAARGHAGATAQAAIAPSVVQLRAQSDSLRAQLQGIEVRLGPNHPDVINLRRQLGETDRAVGAETARVVSATEADARAARGRVTTLEGDMQKSRQAVDSNAQAQNPLDGMQREADAVRVQLQAVLNQIQATAQQAAVEAPDAHEISLALPPEIPSSPRVVPIIAGASAFALMFGLLLIYLAEVTDSSLRSGADIRSGLSLPCFALIPEVPRRRLGRMPVTAYAAMKPMSQFAEQLRALRAGLWMGTARPRIVAVTAASPAEGKTSVTLALGRVAALGGERVCVLDCDIRQPSFGRLLQADGALGLTDLLAGHATDEQVIRQDLLSGMHYIAAGTPEANAFSLFMSEAMALLLRRLRAQFDLVLLDAPPAQAMTDTRVIAGIADATLLCVRWRSTRLDVAANALALLVEAGANVVGAALTRVDAHVHLRSGAADAEVYHPRYGGYFRG
jgi:capsular exopolysaccharide synthesis family protein